MTLEELIKKYERKAKENRQIANNLAELQRYRDGKNSCEFCRYAVKSENQEPCYSCSHRYKDNFRPKKVKQ